MEFLFTTYVSVKVLTDIFNFHMTDSIIFASTLFITTSVPLEVACCLLKLVVLNNKTGHFEQNGGSRTHKLSF